MAGIGTVTAPNSPVPPLEPGDMLRDPKADYAEMRSDLRLGIWIRRAIHAEIFAKALEAELEEARRLISDLKDNLGRG